MLDVACGKGRHSRALADMGFDVTGIDLSFDSIREAKKSENEHLHFFSMICGFPFGSNISTMLLIFSPALAISAPKESMIIPLEL